jgi:hypothetical protein
MFARTAGLPGGASSALTIPMFVASREARVRASMPKRRAELEPTGTKRSGEDELAMSQSA